jgi:hypothetical protein
MDNFYARRPAIVTVPIGHEGYHNALQNTGYVRDLEFDGSTLWALIEFTNQEAEKIVAEGSVPAVSMGIHSNWVDTKDGEAYGEAIYHVALTQSPWIEGMEGFSEMEEDVGTPVLMELVDSDGTDDGGKTNSGNAGGKDDSDMSDEEKKELERLRKEKEQLEREKTQLERDKKTLEDQSKADRQKLDLARTEGIAATVEQIMAGKVEGAKFGLPGGDTMKARIATLLEHSSPNTIELSVGDKTEKTDCGKLLLEVLRDVMATGVVELGDKTRKEDTKPGDGDEGKGFAARQLERKGIGPDKKS